MKQLKEKMEHLNGFCLSKEEIIRYEKLYRELERRLAKENGIDSYFPITFIVELGELISVLGEKVARPDKAISKYDILDEIADVYGLLFSAMEFYDITEEEVQLAATVKLLYGCEKKLSTARVKVNPRLYDEVARIGNACNINPNSAKEKNRRDRLQEEIYKDLANCLGVTI